MTSTKATDRIYNVEIDEGVIAAPAAAASTISSAEIPAQILPEEGQEDEDLDMDRDDEDNEEEDEDEYEYEDDEDAPFVSGFLVNSAPACTLSAAPVVTTSTVKPSVNATASSTIFEEPATIEEEPSNSVPAAKWRQPSREAVNMSLRAEQETTGGKRRLAQDLYRIMNQDTIEAGFSLQPQNEDCMKQWTIKLFQFDPDSNLAKDMLVLGIDHVELEMSFPDQYPFEPPFVRVVRPRFKRQTGFVMNGALCMELLTKDGWNPVNDIESVIVSIRSLLVVGDGRLEAAYNMTEARYQELLQAALAAEKGMETTEEEATPASPSSGKAVQKDGNQAKRARTDPDRRATAGGGSYTTAEAEAAYNHLSDYHKKKGWDSSGWWARKG